MSKLNSISFKNEKERQDFYKYVNLKGEYLHLQICDILHDWYVGKEEISYYEVSSIIRYDKNLRDTLYKYLATCEESMRAKLCRKLELAYTYNGKKYSKWKDNLIEKVDKDLSVLYLNLDIDLGKLIGLFKNYKLDSGCGGNLDLLRKLRNKVMHHNILVAGKSFNKKDAQEELKNLEEMIENLYKLLPTDYRNGFENSINNLNKNRNSEAFISKLCLGVMKDGICK